MKTRLTALLCCLLLTINVFAGTPAYAHNDTADETSALIGGIVAFKQSECGTQSVQEWIDTSLAAGAGSTSEGYIIALHQSGQVYDYSEYSRSLLGYLDAGDVTNAVSRQKYALALLAANCRSEYVSVADETIGQLGIMSWVYGLHLLNNGCVCEKYTVQSVIDTLLFLRLADGGWAVHGEESDVDVTAMVLQALAPHRENAAVSAAADEALAFLSASQLSNGAFASYGIENAESTAQVITALSALGINCRTDQRFIKDGQTALDGMLRFRLEDGSFCHAAGGDYSHMATVQAFTALIAIERQQASLGSVYVLDAQPDNTVSLSDKNAPTGGRLWAVIIIVLLALIACGALFALNKRNSKNYLAVAVIAVIALALALTLDVQTPEDYYGFTASKTDITGSVTVAIRCDTVAGVSPSDIIPADGVILGTCELAIKEGETVYDILIEAARRYNIPVESENGYVSGIGYIYEFDHGDLSGWIYRVNGQTASEGCSSYVLSDGDSIEWLYTCDMGRDLEDSQ